jgi:carbonic anhydrase
MMKPVLFCVLTFNIALYTIPANAQDSWSYSGDTGPVNWGQLSQDYSTCSNGSQQSPIDIEGTDPAILHDLKLHYNVNTIDLRHRGNRIVQSYQADSLLSVGNKKFELKNITFRTPAEHTVSGNSYPIEIQFAHQDKDGRTAILSVLGTIGSENKALSEILANLPLEAGQASKNDNILINVRDLTPHNTAYYRYNGSLTQPPCSEGVSWYLMKTPVEVSSGQVNVLNALAGNNARPTQPRNNRIILDTNK